MVTDPYKVLGISQDASKDEIRKAYRQKAKEYHPDLHPNDPEAARKMNEVNEAYDMLSNPAKYAERQAQEQNRYNHNSSGQRPPHNSQQGAGGWASDFYGFNFDDLFGFGAAGTQNDAGMRPQPEPGDGYEIRTVISHINSGRYRDALGVLMHITSSGRNARWYYLSSLANHGLDNTVQAIDHMQKACQMDPNNRTYHQLLQQFRRAGQTYERNSQGFNTHATHINQICLGVMGASLCCTPYGCMF